MPSGSEGSASSLIEEGWRLLIADRIGDALEIATRATEQEPTNADAWALLGQARFRFGDIEDAIYEYKRAIKLRPGDASFYSDLGSIYESGERWDEAVGQYQRAAQIDPKTTMYRAAVGIVFVKTGKVDEAMGFWSAASPRSRETTPISRRWAMPMWTGCSRAGGSAETNISASARGRRWRPGPSWKRPGRYESMMLS